jgi:hypothetical protein
LLQANFYQDASSMGEMSPFLLFDGDDDAKMDKRGMHSGKTDVAKKVCCCSAIRQAPLSMCKYDDLARPAPDGHAPFNRVAWTLHIVSPLSMAVLQHEMHG